ncbi:MAG: hypothetical protein U9Q76_02420 [candidate division WOR-3 bacterium]|nr:hypothetical protein [candidate division WOR-3 bacterium]
MSEKQSEAIWVVVEVQSGIPVTVEAYRNQKIAQAREQTLRNEINSEDDETDIFEVQVQ